MANGVRYPSPFSERFRPWRECKVGVRYPPSPKGYLSDTRAIPYKNKANGCDTPLCDTISEGYCAIWGGISHWAAKLQGHLSRCVPPCVANLMLCVCVCDGWSGSWGLQIQERAPSQRTPKGGVGQNSGGAPPPMPLLL